MAFACLRLCNPTSAATKYSKKTKVESRKTKEKRQKKKEAESKRVQPLLLLQGLSIQTLPLSSIDIAVADDIKDAVANEFVCI